MRERARSYGGALFALADIAFNWVAKRTRPFLERSRFLAHYRPDRVERGREGKQINDECRSPRSDWQFSCRTPICSPSPRRARVKQFATIPMHHRHHNRRHRPRPLLMFCSPPLCKLHPLCWTHTHTHSDGRPESIRPIWPQQRRRRRVNPARLAIIQTHTHTSTKVYLGLFLFLHSEFAVYLLATR